MQMQSIRGQRHRTIQEIAEAVKRQARSDGRSTTHLPGLRLLKHSRSMPETYFTPRPCLAIVVEGEMVMQLGEEAYRYGPGDYLLITQSVPLIGRSFALEGSRSLVGIALEIDHQQLIRLIERLSLPAAPQSAGLARGVSVGEADDATFEAMLRLMRMLDDPQELAGLAPLAKEEIYFRLLMGKDRHLLTQLGNQTSPASRVDKAIVWLKANFREPIRIHEMAAENGMSVSTLHHSFKAITTMTPIQYQKHLRLYEARRLILVEGQGACAAGFDVGYQSPSQFSKDYKKLFNVQPSRDRLCEREPAALRPPLWRDRPMQRSTLPLPALAL